MRVHYSAIMYCLDFSIVLNPKLVRKQKIIDGNERQQQPTRDGTRKAKNIFAAILESELKQPRKTSKSYWNTKNPQKKDTKA